jgi:ABC-type antimicrobial peptide transport system permease subunit
MKKEFETPAWVDFLIENLSPYHLAEEIRGDLYELYINDIKQQGARKARIRYIRNGIGFLARRFFWRKSPDLNSNSFLMIKNYFKMASRTLMAYKNTTLINILGLVVGIASALVLFTVIRFELSFDAFHSNKDQIYRIVRVSGDDRSEFRAGISYPVPVAIKAEIPAVKNVVSMEYMGGPSSMDIISADGATVEKFMEVNGFVLIEPEFFGVFDFKGTGFKWLSGNPKKSLSEPFSVVLTKTIAKKYFGGRDPLNQILRFHKKFDFKVTGVVEDFPRNSDFPFEVLLSYSSLNTMAGQERLNNWYAVNDTHCTYVVLSPGSAKEEIEREIAKVHSAHTPKELHEHRHYLLQKFSDVHYDARFRNFSGRTISRQTIMGLGIVAVFLLLAGSINYINLSTAQSALRAKEIGLRKVMGSNRRNLMMQFIMETFIVVLIAGVIALGLSEVLLSNLQSLLNINHSSYIFTDPYILLCLLTIVVSVTFFAGVYPSIIISRFNPLTALKYRFSNETVGGMSLRKILVVLQFTITQMLVVSTFIVVSQMRYFENVDMGFNREAIITSKVSNIDADKLEIIREQLRSQSFVSNVSLSFTSPSGLTRNRTYPNIGRPEAKTLEDFAAFEYEAIDPNYLQLYQIKLVAGRNLSMSDSVGNILINKTLVKNLALGGPDDALGQTLKFGDGKLVTVVGVVDDFYSNSLKEGVDNIVMLIDPKKYFTMSIKLTTHNERGSMQENIKAIEKIWYANFPDFIFNYQFFDENIDSFYKQERKYAQLFQLFSGVFLFIGCLGLYGLIAFVVNRKGKEVAIRKVLGATLSNILLLFSREYIQLIILSFVLAAPVAYYIVDGWLSTFANRIELQWWLFVLPGIMVLIIALLVVGTKSFTAANANPVDKLKYE